jgi:hypothetical protein
MFGTLLVENQATAKIEAKYLRRRTLLVEN